MIADSHNSRCCCGRGAELYIQHKLSWVSFTGLALCACVCALNKSDWDPYGIFLLTRYSRIIFPLTPQCCGVRGNMMPFTHQSEATPFSQRRPNMLHAMHTITASHTCCELNFEPDNNTRNSFHKWKSLFEVWC